jgi:hypothetical protein
MPGRLAFSPVTTVPLVDGMDLAAKMKICDVDLAPCDGRATQPRIREKLSDVMSPDRRGGDESRDTNASNWTLDGGIATLA